MDKQLLYPLEWWKEKPQFLSFAIKYMTANGAVMYLMNHIHRPKEEDIVKH